MKKRVTIKKSTAAGKRIAELEKTIAELTATLEDNKRSFETLHAAISGLKDDLELCEMTLAPLISMSIIGTLNVERPSIKKCTWFEKIIGSSFGDGLKKEITNVPLTPHVVLSFFSRGGVSENGEQTQCGISDVLARSFVSLLGDEKGDVFLREIGKTHLIAIKFQ